MLIGTALAESTIDRLDTELLLAFLLQRERSWILAHPDEALGEEQAKEFQTLIKRRSQGEPIAYIVGEKEFYGRLFTVNRHVLIPRPATEQLIDLTLDFLKTGRENVRDADADIVVASRSFGDVSDVETIVDIGTGSGCIAVTLALERAHVKVVATDISEEALSVARANAQRHGVLRRIDFRIGNLLEPVQELREPFIVVSNPPYIPEGTELMRDVLAFEPEHALFAGPRGLNVLAPLLLAARKLPCCRGIVFECFSAGLDFVTVQP